MDFTKQKLHFMGIGGIGMSALAALAKSRGADISGCDSAPNEQTAQLQQLGIPVVIGHAPEHSRNIDGLIHTSAIPLTHPEIKTSSAKIWRRGEFLAEVLRELRVIGIAGAHGKTTTTWLIAHLFLAANLDPTILLGGAVEPLNGNYRVGGELAIAELDESDGSFLLPTVETAVITNIEAEHLAYYRTLNKVVKAFTKFAEKISTQGTSTNGTNTNGTLVICVDNPHCREIYAQHRGKKCSYGVNAAEKPDYTAKNRRYENGKQLAEIYQRGENVGTLHLPLAGEHNLLNALAAIAVGEIYGIAPARALNFLATVRGVKRRWEKIGKLNGVTAYSDYAHHPTEITATLSGARQLLGAAKMLVVYQPHLYSRTRDNAAAFAAALQIADAIIVVEIYPAREEPIDGVTSALITEKIAAEKLAVKNPLPVSDAIAAAKTAAKNFDLVVFMGAGDIDETARKRLQN